MLSYMFVCLLLNHEGRVFVLGIQRNLEIRNTEVYFCHDVWHRGSGQVLVE